MQSLKCITDVRVELFAVLFPTMIVLHSRWAYEKLYIIYKEIQWICKVLPSLLYLVALWADSKNLCKPHLLQRQLLLHVTTWKMWSGLRVALVFIVDLWRLFSPAAALFLAWRLLENVTADACKWHSPCLGMFCWWVCKTMCVAQTAEQMVQL